jgi:NADH-quinone oxidoreductase subunit A
MSEYIGILMLVAVAAVLCGAMVTLSWVLGPKKRASFKESPYECGVAPIGDAKERFPIKFYLVAIVFILFDIEVVFLWPWMTVFKWSDTQFMVTSFASFALYMLTFIVGYLYVIGLARSTGMRPLRSIRRSSELKRKPRPRLSCPPPE